MPNGTTVKILLGISGIQPPFTGTGTVEVDGTSCAVASTSAIGGQFMNSTGTFTGTLPASTPGSPVSGTSAAVSLTITQSASAGADGQFAATGTINYTVGSCSGSAPLTGTVSGVSLTLASTNNPSGNSPYLGFIGGMNQAASTISLADLQFLPAPCSTDPQSYAIYSGQLNRQ